MAEPPRFDAYRPNLPPSDTVHISPARSESGTVLSGGPDYWAALGFTLKGLLMEVYGVHESYLDLAPSLDTDFRYDVELLLPCAESRDRVIGRIQRAIGQQLRIDVSRRIRSMDVYVLTAPDEMASSEPFSDMAGVGAFASSWQMDDAEGVPPLQISKAAALPFSFSWFSLSPHRGEDLRISAGSCRSRTGS